MVNHKEWAGRIGAAMTAGGFAAGAAEVLKYRAAVLEDAAFNLWRNGDDVPPPPRSTRSARGKDRIYAVAKLRRLAGGKDNG